MKKILSKFRLATICSFILITAFPFFPKTIAADWIYVVSEGDNLWNLSERYLGSSANWEKVQRINQLPDPNWIRPGTRLRIPLDWLKNNGVPASIQTLTGKAYLLNADGSSSLLAVGNKLQLGDRIQTSTDASIAIEFADGSIVTLGPNSELGFDHLSAYDGTGMVDTRMRLYKGRLETRVTPAVGAGSRYEIHSASAVSTVRGTSYRMAQDSSDQSSSIEVTGGVVDVSDSAGLGKEKLLNGYGTVVKSGEAPLPPRKLLPAPNIEKLPTPLDAVRWPVAWSEVFGAAQYRAQLSESRDFTVIRWEQVVTEPQINLPEMDDGTFYLRVRAIDSDSLEGLDAFVEINQDAYPLAPQPHTKASRGNILISWKPWVESDTYHVQLARDSDFNDLISESELTEAQMTVKNSSDNTQYFRVKSISTDGDSSSWSASQEVPPDGNDSWKWAIASYLLMALAIF